MKTTIDAAGRIVVPKAMRRRLGLEGPAEVQIELRDGAVEIRPEGREVQLVTGEDGRPLLRAPQGTPPLTDEDVRRMIDESREWPRNY
ncbi:MAG: AbrB/MazE/SpoVT family DNA-binding domain-containing protein [Actinomycetota bacterium]|nr:AbrB/MazE/SpoVT family DNA-binding domain-containing protein [Actinomycetota bacterium]